MSKATERLNRVLGEQIDQPSSDQAGTQQEKGLADRLALCIEKLTKSCNQVENSILEHDKRITALESWAKKCAEATAARAAVQSDANATKAQPVQPEPKPVQPTTPPVTQSPAVALPNRSTDPGADGYAVEDGPRVMYKYHKRIKMDDGRFIDTWAGPKMTRREAEQAGSGLTQEILAWIKDGKIVLIEPIVSREKI